MKRDIQLFTKKRDKRWILNNGRMVVESKPTYRKIRHGLKRTMVTLNDPFGRNDALSTVVAQLMDAGFECAEEIGHGRFGVVWRCLESSLDRTVAVKVLNSALDSQEHERFRREQRAMGKLSGHPNIVSVFQIGELPIGLSYMVMEYAPAGTLAQWIHKDGPLDWSKVVHLGVKLAGGLEIAHRSRVFHGDVSPANILFTEYGEPQLTDFGIARIFGGFETTVCVLAESPAFLAPETLKGNPASVTQDIFGLGATLFCALTGQSPFERFGGEQLAAQILGVSSHDISDLRGRKLPDDVCDVVEYAMKRTLSDRFSDAADFGENLRSIQLHHDLHIDEMVLVTTKYRAHVAHEVSELELPNKSPSNENSPRLTGTRSIASKHQVRGSSTRDLDRDLFRIHRNEGNIPLSLTSFVGRRRELFEVKKMLSASRLLTLTGVGGVGKTKLALRAAKDLRRSFKNGVWMVELADIQDSILLYGAVASVFGIRTYSAEPLSSILVNYLSDRQLLLVLDNCEHLVDSVAGLAELLLESCPGVRILATSRESLSISGEVAVRVPPMSVPEKSRDAYKGVSRYDAVELFRDRAVLALPEFKLTSENEGVVAQICQKLEGLPLLIELAAVRLRTMAVQQILDHLTDRFELLTLGRRGSPSRQRTLRLCIDWSFDLCTSVEQDLWANLTVFAGSFELEAVHAVCADGDLSGIDLLDAVSSLVEKSILIREESSLTVRYKMLDTLRDYCQEKLGTNSVSENLQLRHRNWYAKFVRDAENDWNSPRQSKAISRIESERANIVEALHFCLRDSGEAEVGVQIASSLFPFWLSRGLFTEGRFWLDRLLSVHNRNPSIGLAKSLYASSVLAAFRDEIRVGESLLADANMITSCLGSNLRTSMNAYAKYAAGCLSLHGGAADDAVKSFEESINIAKEGVYIFCQFGSILGVEFAHMLNDDHEGTLEYHKKMLSISEGQGELVYLGRSSVNGGWSYWRSGKLEMAISEIISGLQISFRSDDPVGFARGLQVLAWIESSRHDFSRSAVLLGAAKSSWGEIRGFMENFVSNLRYQKVCELENRESLGDVGFEKQFIRGHAMTASESLAFAIGEKSVEPESGSGLVQLTPRESEVAGLVAEGKKNREIASRLVISPRTVQGHVEHILVKLGFTSRAQIAAWVISQTNARNDREAPRPQF